MVQRRPNLTYKQVQTRKDKAVRFLRDVLDDPDRADEVDAESVEDYAARRHFVLKNARTNPTCRLVSPIIHERKVVSKMAKREKLEDVLSDRDELLDKLEDVRNQVDDILSEYDGDDDSDDDDSGDDADDDSGD